MILLTLAIGFLCKAQKINTKLSSEEYEVLSVFLKAQNIRGYVNKFFLNKNEITMFTGRYDYNKKFYDAADSICKTSLDTTKLKFYCPLADKFKIYNHLLTEEDFIYMVSKYDKIGNQLTLDFKRLKLGRFLKEHSDKFYNQFINDLNDSIMIDNEEFPSIQINNLYFNKEKDVAIVSYMVVHKPKPNYSSTSGFYILKRLNNIWWKPLGNLKF